LINDKYLTFIVVANEGSFSRAAEMLYMSAVAVRKQMNVLEKELDLQLFKRTSQGVKLTDAGEILLEGIQTVKGASEQVFERLSNYRNSLEKNN
jgi:Transcriptional regulator